MKEIKGLSLNKLMEIDVETLKQAQHDALKGFVLSKLDEVKRLIEEERYEDVKLLTYNSPAGDGYGTDKDFIDFSYDEDIKNRNYGTDILEITEKLKGLKTEDCLDYLD